MYCCLNSVSFVGREKDAAIDFHQQLDYQHYDITYRNTCTIQSKAIDVLIFFPDTQNFT